MQRYSRERHSGMDWRRRYKPLFQFGKKARVTLWLLVPLFYSTAFCKISCQIIGDFAEGCRFSLNHLQSDTTISAIIREKSRNIFCFAGK